jgi:hypothetical protein
MLTTALGEPADLIGFHGQTILHDAARRQTWQIGDATCLARATDIPIVHDFRSADVAAGGQGAPFTPAFYYAALATCSSRRAGHNVYRRRTHGARVICRSPERCKLHYEDGQFLSSKSTDSRTVDTDNSGEGKVSE